MSSAVEQIKSRLSIVDVVGSYLKLEKSGGNFKAKCPFHNEKTPSFYVSPSRESYHCFGCDKGGDIINFVEEIERVDFMGALKILADKAGIEIDNSEKYEKSEKGRIFSLFSSAIEFYRKELIKNKEALEYLRKRGLKGETITKFKIGFAPNEWRKLYDHLKKEKYTDKEMETAGLIIKSEKGYYDRFRSRIMFPIFSISGSPIAFSGRIFESANQAPSKQAQAKYINSPQTIVYDKSRVLYGIDKAKVPIRQKGECILVEGQVDLVMSHQAGVDNALAVSGTALTEEHLETINRLGEKLIMAFDGDPAGLKASGRAINMALSLGMDVRLAVIKDAKDPADIVMRNPEEWVKIVSNSKHIVDFFIDSIQNKNLNSDKFAKEIEIQVLPYVANIKSKIEQAKFVNKISELLKIGEDAVWEEVKKAKNVIGENITKESKGQKPPENKEYGLKRRLWSIINWQKKADDPVFDWAEKEKKIIEILGEEEYKKLDKNLSPKKNELILEVEISFSGSTDLTGDVDNMIKDLHEDVIKVLINAEWQKIKLAEIGGDTEKLSIHLKEFEKLSKKLDVLRKS